MQLLLLLLLLGDSSGQTAYLVGSMQQTYEASNSSFNSLGGVIRAQPAYSTIVLTEDYWMSPGEFQAADQVRLSQPLLITSSPGEQHQLSFAFLVRPQKQHEQLLPRGWETGAALQHAGVCVLGTGWCLRVGEVPACRDPACGTQSGQRPESCAVGWVLTVGLRRLCCVPRRTTSC